jgi:hypothetical protein
MPVMRGTAYLYSDTRAYLWTMGYVPRLDTYPGWEVPNPLAVDVLRGKAPLEHFPSEPNRRSCATRA